MQDFEPSSKKYLTCLVCHNKVLSALNYERDLKQLFFISKDKQRSSSAIKPKQRKINLFNGNFFSLTNLYKTVINDFFLVARFS